MRQQLILQFQTQSVEDYDLVIAFEDKLIELLKTYDEVDGHDVTGKYMNIFILSYNPAATFEKIENSGLIPTCKLLSKVVSRVIGSDNFNTLWPSNLESFKS